MKMPAKKSNSRNAALLAAVLILAACDRAEKPAAEAAPAPFVQVAAVDNIDAHLPTVVERRHFAIYNTYRVLFDDSAVFKSPAGAKEEGALHAVAALEGDIFACSMRTMLPQD